MNWSNQWFAAPSGEKKHETKDLWVCSIPLDPLVVDVKSIKMVCLSQSVSTFLGADLPSFSRRSPIAMQFFKPCSGCPITMTFFRDSTFSKHTEKEKDDYIHSWKAKVHVWRGQFFKKWTLKGKCLALFVSTKRWVIQDMEFYHTFEIHPCKKHFQTGWW